MSEQPNGTPVSVSHRRKREKRPRPKINVEQLPPFIDEETAAAIIGISAQTLKNQALATGKPRRITVGPRRVAYRLADILSL